MNSQLQKQLWNPGHRAGLILRNVVYLLLTTLIVVDLTGSGYRAVQRLLSPPQLTEVSALDSFSAPSAAVATLKKEAKVLLLDYTEARDAAASGFFAQATQQGQVTNQGRETSRIHFGGFARGSLGEVTRIRPIEKLHATVQDVDLEIKQELLLVYYENNYDKELVDSFLGLLHELPQSPEVLEWVRVALDCSQRCGRTQEVADALENAIRYHPNLKTGAQLIALKRGWETEQQSFSKTSHSQVGNSP